MGNLSMQRRHGCINKGFGCRNLEKCLKRYPNSAFAMATATVVLYIFWPILSMTSRRAEVSRISMGSTQNLDAITPERRWCMLTKDEATRQESTWISTIEHFPHTLEWYSDCWTWLQEQSEFIGADVSGGFIVDEYVQRKLSKKYWNRAFIPAIQFPLQVVYSNGTDAMPEEHLISRKVYTSGWFQRSDTCSSFRERLWKNLEINPPKVSPTKRRIGILDRNESRAIRNIPGLIRELKVHFNDKAIDIDVRTFDSEYELTSERDTLSEQARWFAAKDLIIVAHGAALSNVVFMRPGSAVLELFPRYYFNDMFWELMNQCGIRHSWYYDGDVKKKYSQKSAQKETDEEWDNRFVNKKNDITFHWRKIDHLIRVLLESMDTNDDMVES